MEEKIEEKQEPIIEIPEVDKELEDILENEVKYDSDGVARGSSPGRPPSSTGSVGSNESRGSKGKRRTWKKPKDKPKRPLSAYNLFFKHERSRIVEGKPDYATPEEIVRSIEGILSTSRETRRHRKTHGRISFGDLARKIAEKWKGINPEEKAVFEHYAELDMRRYRREVKLWKEKKETEAITGKTQGSLHSHDSMDNSFSSIDSASEFSMEAHLNANSVSTTDAWAPRRNFYDSMNSSFSSTCSIDSEASLEPLPIGSMLRNARPNMHASMPNLGFDSGIPGYVQGEFQANSNMQQPDVSMQQFGQQSLSSMHMGGRQGVQMDNLSNSFNHLQMQQQQNSLQQLQQQNLEQQRQQLMMQQRILAQQQQQLQRQIQMQQQQSMMNNSGHGPPPQQQQMGDPIPLDQVFDMPPQDDGNGDPLDSFIQNFDLWSVSETDVTIVFVSQSPITTTKTEKQETPRHWLE